MARFFTALPVRLIPKSVLTLGLLASLAACGSRAPDRTPSTLFATGPIYSACMKANRKAANRSRCGCVQAVANSALRDSDQSRAASFFSDPQRAQDTRQSDNPLLESYWKRYKGFVASAEKSCG